MTTAQYTMTYQALNTSRMLLPDRQDKVEEVLATLLYVDTEEVLHIDGTASAILLLHHHEAEAENEEEEEEGCDNVDELAEVVKAVEVKAPVR